MSKPYSYNGNPNLKAAGVAIEWEPGNVAEWMKCQADPIYFIENYVKIVTLDHGVQLMKLFEYQKEIVNSLWKNRKTAAVICRQAGKCVSSDTKYRVRNKTTGEIYELTAEEFHNMCKNTSRAS